jgi:hypothetical protein
MDLGPLQKVAGRNMLFKSLAREKMVLTSILLSRAWRPRRTGNDLHHIRHGRHNPLADGRFASS